MSTKSTDRKTYSAFITNNNCECLLVPGNFRNNQVSLGFGTFHFLLQKLAVSDFLFSIWWCMKPPAYRGCWARWKKTLTGAWFQPWVSPWENSLKISEPHFSYVRNGDNYAGCLPTFMDSVRLYQGNCCTKLCKRLHVIILRQSHPFAPTSSRPTKPFGISYLKRIYG